jgi:hypothetical protein
VQYESYGTKFDITARGSDFQYINMNLPFKEYGASPTWKGKRVRIHSPSEHMIGGTRYDMELVVESDRVQNIGQMKMVFSSFLFSINSPTALFCTKDCVAAIDNFFDDLQLEKTSNPRVNGIRFADAFMHFDTDNRFNYIGSGTIPPCNKFNMRDVIMTIYPVKQRHVDAFRDKQLSRNAKTKWDPEAGTGGNYRAMNPTIAAHRVFVVTNEYSALTLLLLVLTVVFGVSCFICTICCCCYCCKHKKLKAQTMPSGGPAKGKGPAGKGPVKQNTKGKK